MQELYKKAGSDKERASLKKQIEAQQKEVNRISLTSKKEKDPYLEMLTKRKEKYADYLKWVTSKDETLRKAANTEFATLLKEGTSYLDYQANQRSMFDFIKTPKDLDTRASQFKNGCTLRPRRLISTWASVILGKRCVMIG